MNNDFLLFICYTYQQYDKYLIRIQKLVSHKKSLYSYRLSPYEKCTKEFFIQSSLNHYNHFFSYKNSCYFKSKDIEISKFEEEIWNFIMNKDKFKDMYIRLMEFECRNLF